MAGSGVPRSTVALDHLYHTSTIDLKDNNFAPYNGVASPYPSTIGVSGFTAGQTVSVVTVTLNTINWELFSNGNYQSYAEDFKAMLVAPTGQSLVFMSTCGPSFATNPGFNNVTLTFEDASSTTFSEFQSFASSGSMTSKPVDYNVDNYSSSDSTAFVSPAPSNFKQAAPTGSGTFASIFNGLNPNGTWDLYLSTDGGDSDSTGTVAGWSIGITAGAIASTTTTLSSSVNPTFTASPNNTTTLTATVTSSGSPVTQGTVTFTDTTTGAVLSGGSDVVLNGSGQASLSANFTTEGKHVIEALYNGNSDYNTSETTVNQIVNNHTTVNGNTFSNPGTIKLMDNNLSPGGRSAITAGHRSATSAGRPWRPTALPPPRRKMVTSTGP